MLNKLKFLLSGLSDNEARKTLMHIKCEVIDNTLYMLSANSFIIKTITCHTDEENCKFFIDLDSVKKIIKIAGKNDIIQLFPTKAIIGNIDINYQCDSEDMNYPDLDSLMTSDFTKPMEYMAINPKFLQLALKDAPKDNNCIAFRFSGNTGPIKIDFGKEHTEYSAYIMPVQIDW